MIEALLNFFSPFRMMKDVSRGTFEQRMAAYRYNRTMLGHLTACMRRWIISCGVAIGLTSVFDTMSDGASTAGPDVFVLLAAACATFIACGICVLSVSVYVYLYLTSHDY